MHQESDEQIPQASNMQENIVFANEQCEAFLSKLTIANRSGPIVQT